MIKLGIIAEYNPFHNGHEYQIQYAKNIVKAEEVIVIMSGNFTQRGIPAICDKYLRAQAAICAGADLVIEMPVDVATADTPMFAQGAVDVLLRFGCNALLFGSERDNLGELKQISEIISKDEYWSVFEKNKKEGMSPDEARIDAIKELSDVEIRDYSFINQPNNLLGIYYLCGLMRRNANIEIFTNKRKGQNYFDEDVPTDSKIYASATSARKMIKQCVCDGDFTFEKLKPYLPHYMINALIKAFDENRIIFQEDFGDLFLQAMDNVDEETWNRVCPMIDHKVVRERIRQGDDFRRVREVCIQYASELKVDRMLAWILLNKPQLTLNEFLSSNHMGWQVLASQNAYKDANGELYSEELKRSWDYVEQIYAMRFRRD